MSEQRLIDANALKTRINNVPMHGDSNVFYDIMSELVSVVASAPTIDAEPVRHAEWLILNSEKCECSACGGEQFYDKMLNDQMPNYCANCGARMDEVSE